MREAMTYGWIPMIERAVRRILRYGIAGLMAACGLSAAASAGAQTGTSDLELTATLLPPAPWVEYQRVTLTVTARNLLATPAVGTIFEDQPQIPGGGTNNNSLIGFGMPSSTCQPSPLCTEFGNTCWTVGLVQGFQSQTCRVDFQVPGGVPAISGLMRVRLIADPADFMSANNEVLFPASTLVVTPVPTLSTSGLVVLCGMLMILLWFAQARVPS